MKMRLLNRNIRDEGGFTLLEILVVCFIISILVTMGLSSFIKARQRGYETAAMHGMRTLGAAMEAYHNDYGRFAQSFRELQPRYIDASYRLSDATPARSNPVIRHFSLAWTYYSAYPHMYSINAIGLYDHWQVGNDRIELRLTQEGTIERRYAGQGNFGPAY